VLYPNTMSTEMTLMILNRLVLVVVRKRRTYIVRRTNCVGAASAKYTKFLLFTYSRAKIKVRALATEAVAICLYITGG